MRAITHDGELCRGAMSNPITVPLPNLFITSAFSVSLNARLVNWSLGVGVQAQSFKAASA